MSGYGGRGGGRGAGDFDGYGSDEYSGYDGRAQQGRPRPGQSSWDDRAAGQAQRGRGYGGYDAPGGQRYDQRGNGQYPRAGQPASRGPGGQPAQRGNGQRPRPGGYQDKYPSGGYRQSGYDQDGGGYAQGGDWNADGDDAFLPGFGGRDQGGRYEDDYRDPRDVRDPRGRDPRGGAPRDGRGPAGRGSGGRGPAAPGRDRDPRGASARDGEAWDGYQQGKRRRGPVRRFAPWVAFLVIVVPLAVGGWWVYGKYQARYHPADYTGAGTGTVMVQVKSGDTAFSLAPELVTLGVIASDRAFENAANAASAATMASGGTGNGLEAGFFTLHHHMQASLAWAALTNPKNMIQTTATIPEGWRASQIVGYLAKKTKIPLRDFQQVIAHPAQLGLPAYAKGKVEGYLFPATYPIVPHETAPQILRAMVQRFNTEAVHINIAAAAKSVGLTPEQLIIEASMVQAEGGRLSDFPKIAEVTNNRIKAGMPLHYDSTVLYGFGKFGTRATDAEIHTPGPYNTYINKGLPPTPISSPGDAAIQAVLHPAVGNLYFFLGCTNGKTLFANQLNELGSC